MTDLLIPPENNVDDFPAHDIRVNAEWWSHISGVISRLTDRDAWHGTDDQVTHAINQINKILNVGEPIFRYSFWTADVPANVADFDNPAIAVGMKFQASVAGKIVGIRFYKAATNTGEHTGHLFASDGTLLGSVTFVDETAFGWQEAYFDAPLAITASTLYVAAYHMVAGNYSYDHSYFNAAFEVPPLTAPASGDVGGNGVYKYTDVADTFPDDVTAGTNFWVDVIFQPD